MPNNNIRKNNIKSFLLPFLIIIIIAAVCLCFASKKDGYHIDEIYSFGLANSRYAPYLTDIKNGDMVDKVFTRQELLEYLTIGEDDGFSPGSVYYNQTQDVHPPLFYWLLNLVSSIFRNAGFSKWPALGMNLVLYLAASLLLYAVAERLFESRAAALVALILYGLSSIGISCFIMIRMYTLLTLLTLLLAFLIITHSRSRSAYLYPLIALTVFAGMMTQYYYVFYAFFLCAAYDIYMLAEKKYRDALMFSLSALLGVGLMVTAFPACIKHIFVGNGQVVSGGNALENIKDFSVWKTNIISFLGFSKQSRIIIWVFVFSAACALVLLLAGRNGKSTGGQFPNAMAWVIIIPAVIAFFAVAVVSPVIQARYIYNLVPVLVLSLCPAVKKVENCIDGFRFGNIIKYCGFAALVLLCIWDLGVNPPDYLYEDEKDFTAVTAKYTDIPCVYFDDNYFAPITADIPQLLQFDEFLVFNDTASEAFKDYISRSDRFIAFIDNSWYWSGGVYYELVRWRIGEDTGYTNSELVYEHGLSIAFVFEKP